MFFILYFVNINDSIHLVFAIFPFDVWIFCRFFSVCVSQVTSSTATLVLDLLNFLMDAIQTNFQQDSALGSSSRAQQALNELHTQDKTVEMTDQLMVQYYVQGVCYRFKVADWIVS